MKNMTSKNNSRPEQNIQTDFQKEMSYGDYLHLHKILDSQQRLSGHHDEMLFIIIHQTSELWMKLILHEVKAAISCIRNDNLEASFKMLSRVSRIQQQLIQSWNILSTLTPAEYMEFRDDLGKSSGFQSYQNRLIEFSLGNKNAHTLAVYKHDKNLFNQMQQALHEPSIYDEAVKAMFRRGLPINEQCLNRDYSEQYEPNESIELAWLEVYRNVNQYWDLYELAEKLVDIGSQQQLWRFNHVTTVERIIGHKTGTGGSSGVTYLKRALDQHFFPELWSLRTKI
ncbi:tryptophan 2,3-dioxygenase [Priestia filamentosa]|uniref:Tryptophan 2,3-dioxygenase n=2 Tax=Priestia filamentosa TaxID=1402861 RepID=A0A0H4KBF6_9BACI|nr:tryptophan 2,3-dioxygenase [Priestia filamentosa]AKO91432.1 tryptophan 2,3-dioxygenase [Priestia filamentosa]MDT3761518.1 tryptophan 2,3-dioxygenase [Priestia filamentosa]RJS65171.1 tryptophan 2,3-dioxygenase [Priestia filamentosa]WCM16626.1 tryptophan 2,3-dioxygenase [Priestia filamentosa]WRU96047.1 tryptophan 2,3-dioxygenase [Priestia filamentosa]